jgi:hypothetical protein
MLLLAILYAIALSDINKNVVNASETWLANAFARLRKHLLDDIRICFFYY